MRTARTDSDCKGATAVMHAFALRNAHREDLLAGTCALEGECSRKAWNLLRIRLSTESEGACLDTLDRDGIPTIVAI
jgi:hypothetical protein